MTPAPQGQQMTPTSKPASSGSGGDIMSCLSVTSDQVVIGNKCMFTLSHGHFSAVSMYSGRVLIHVRDYIIVCHKKGGSHKGR